MSTRSIVATGNSKEWLGCYNHSDSDPKWLGPKLWRVLQEIQRTGHGLEEISVLIKKYGRWELLQESFLIGVSERDYILEPVLIKSGFEDPLVHEWIYIVNPEENKLIVLGAEPFNVDAANGRCEYRYRLVSEASLQAEPDWEKIEVSHRLARRKADELRIRILFGDAAAEKYVQQLNKLF